MGAPGQGREAAQTGLGRLMLSQKGEIRALRTRAQGVNYL